MKTLMLSITAILTAGSGFSQNQLGLDPLLIPLVTPRYTVAFAKTEMNSPIRSATVVTVTNNSSIGCLVNVAWFGKSSAASACINGLVVPAGQTVNLCSRALPSEIADCASACTVSSADGRATVQSRLGEACGKIAVDARVYYTEGGSDNMLTAVTSSKVVKAGAANAGD